MSCQKHFVCLSVSLPRPSTLSFRPGPLPLVCVNQQLLYAVRGSCAAHTRSRSSILTTVIRFHFPALQPLSSVGSKGVPVTERKSNCCSRKSHVVYWRLCFITHTRTTVSVSQFLNAKLLCSCVGVDDGSLCKT